MNIYDFDNTIFKGDSSVKFIKYSLWHHPLIVLISLCKTLKEVIKKLFHKSDFNHIKSELFSFVKSIPDFDNYVEAFVLKNMKNIKKFYLEGQRENDTIISASCEFIIRPFCEKLGIKNIIATKYNIKDGKIIGNNCKGKEKIKRFRELFPDAKVKNAYSDSLSDIPMFEIATNGYLVKAEKIIEYKN